MLNPSILVLLLFAPLRLLRAYRKSLSIQACCWL
nr:MAG TPA: hypothetical protein [Caudoviricetes sp.]